MAQHRKWYVCSISFAKHTFGIIIKYREWKERANKKNKIKLQQLLVSAAMLGKLMQFCMKSSHFAAPLYRWEDQKSCKEKKNGIEQGNKNERYCEREREQARDLTK